MKEKKQNSNFKIPKNSLVIIVGIPGAGKTEIAKRVAKRNGVVISVNDIRKEVNGNEKNQENGDLVFEKFHKRISDNLKNDKLVVADATSINEVSRGKIYSIGILNKKPIRVLVLNMPLSLVLDWNKKRGNKLKEEIITRRQEYMEKAYRQIDREIVTLRRKGIDIKACDIVERNDSIAYEMEER